MIMDYEEKYKQALERAKDFIEKQNPPAFDKDLIGTIFPEFAESEDEKMRKAIIELVRQSSEILGMQNQSNMLAWLEKQGESYTKRDVDNAFVEGMACAKDELEKQSEQKFAWSEEDERLIKTSIAFLADYAAKGYENAVECIDWLKSLKDRVQPQPKQEWSEEDERIRQCLIRDQEEALDDVRNDKYGHSEIISDLKEMYRERIDWFKSLKDRIGG